MKQITQERVRDCTPKIPSLTQMVAATDRIHEAFGGSGPIDVAIRRDACKLYDISFGVASGTTKRIYSLRQAAEGWVA